MHAAHGNTPSPIDLVIFDYLHQADLSDGS